VLPERYQELLFISLVAAGVYVLVSALLGARFPSQSPQTPDSP
jgi:hypothetical protein